MLDKNLHFFTQNINCTCEENCFGIEILTRVGEVRESIENLLNNLNSYEKKELDILILKRILIDYEDFLKINSKINLNVHIETLFNTEYIDKINKLNNKGFSIFLELLEYSNVNNKNFSFDKINYIIRNLQNKGIKVGIDDYPVGITELLIRKLDNLDFIKIDKQVLLKENKNFILIINNYVNFIKKYQKNALIIVEGVEKGKYINTLSKLGIDAFQGYYFGKPKEIKKTY